MRQPIVGEPRGCVAVVAVLLGLFLSLPMLFKVTEPQYLTCGDQLIQPGDTCVVTTWNGQGAHTRSHTIGSDAEYEHELHKDRVVDYVILGTGGALVGLGLWLGGFSFRRRRLPRAPLGAPQHSEGTLRLSAAAAAAGGLHKVKVSVRVLCPRCDGTRWHDGKRCRRCRATGLGRTVRRTVTLPIPAGTRNGTIVRAKGEGTPGVTAVRPAGDLRVRVRVRGRGTGRRQDGPAGGNGPERPSRTSVGGAVRSSHVIVTAGASGFQVRRHGRAQRWETKLDLPWQRIRRLSFDTGPHDEVLSLYAWTTDPGRRYVCDVRHLTLAEWRTLADYVRQASGGSVTLDLAGRE